MKNKAKDAEYISKLRASNSPKLKSIQAKQEKKDIANLYIKNNFPQERYPTQTIGYEMYKTLRRPFSYQKKTKFIIHHTVTDASKLLTQQDVYIYLQKLQKLHSLTR